MRGTDTAVLSEEERSVYHWGAIMSESRDRVEETEPVQEVAERQLSLKQMSSGCAIMLDKQCNRNLFMHLLDLLSLSCM